MEELVLLGNTAPALCSALLSHCQAGTFVPCYVLRVMWLLASQDIDSQGQLGLISQPKKLSIKETPELWLRADFTEHPGQKAKQTHPTDKQPNAPQQGLWARPLSFCPAHTTFLCHSALWLAPADLIAVLWLGCTLKLLWSSLHWPHHDMCASGSQVWVCVFEPALKQRSYFTWISGFESRTPMPIEIVHKSPLLFYCLFFSSRRSQQNLPNCTCPSS